MGLNANSCLFIAMSVHACVRGAGKGHREPEPGAMWPVLTNWDIVKEEQEETKSGCPSCWLKSRSPPSDAALPGWAQHPAPSAGSPGRVPPGLQVPHPCPAGGWMSEWLEPVVSLAGSSRDGLHSACLGFVSSHDIRPNYSPRRALKFPKCL